MRITIDTKEKVVIVSDHKSEKEKVDMIDLFHLGNYQIKEESPKQTKDK